MRFALMIVLALSAGSASADTIVVDPAGDGNFDSIAEAMFRGSAEDTGVRRHRGNRKPLQLGHHQGHV